MIYLAEQSWPRVLVALTLLISISAAGGLAAQTDKDTAAAPKGTEDASTDVAADWDADARVRQMMAEWKATDPFGSRFRERSERGEIFACGRCGAGPIEYPRQAMGKVPLARVYQSLY